MVILVIVSSISNALWSALCKERIKVFRLFPFLGIVFSIKFLISVVIVRVISGFNLLLALKGYSENYFSTYTFVSSAPVLTVILAVIFLKEKLMLNIIIATILVAIGTFLFQQQKQFSTYGILAALG